MSDPKPATRFVLSRYRWWGREGHYQRLPGTVTVASFATFEEANAKQAKREADVRAKVNPFACGGAVHHWSHLDEPRLCDWLMDHAIEPPDPNKDGRTNWAGWWKKNQKKLGAEKRAVVWEVLDKVRFYIVSEQPIRPVGYAVVGLNWEYNDNYYTANSESGQLVNVYRSRERAEVECAKHNEKTLAQWTFISDAEVENFDPEHDDPAFDMSDWLCLRRGLMDGRDLKRGEGLYPTTAGVPFFEVVEVELEGLE